MAKFKFVGYQEHVEIPEGFEKLELSAVVECGDIDPFSLVSQPAELSKWFYPIIHLDAKASGKITFADASIDGLCVASDLGKSITLVSTEFGELSATIKGKLLHIDYQVLTDNAALRKSKFDSQINLLTELVK